MKTIKDKLNFPDEKEIERITKHFLENPQEINQGLMPNASELDKAKYDICQSISRYKRINNLTPVKLAQKLEINQENSNKVCLKYTCSQCNDSLFTYGEKPKKSITLTPRQYESLLTEMKNIYQILYQAKSTNSK